MGAKASLGIVTLALASLSGVQAQSPYVSDEELEAEAERESKRRFYDALFDSELPFTNPDSSWELQIKPKLGDVDDEPFIRLPMELRYGFTEQREGLIGYTPYLSNPFQSDAVSSWGYLNLGIKQRLDPFINDNWDLAFGLKARTPVDDIPAEAHEIRNNYALYEPYVVFTHENPNHPRWQHVLSMSYIWVDDDPFNVVDASGPRPDSLFTLRPGLIYKPPGEWRYSLEVDYMTERLDGGVNDSLMVIPGVVWYPDRRKRNIPVPGDFDVGLRFGLVIDSLPEERGRSDLQVSLRVRYRLDSLSRDRLKAYFTGNGGDTVR